MIGPTAPGPVLGARLQPPQLWPSANLFLAKGWKVELLENKLPQRCPPPPKCTLEYAVASHT